MRETKVQVGTILELSDLGNAPRDNYSSKRAPGRTQADREHECNQHTTNGCEPNEDDGRSWIHTLEGLLL